MRLFLIIVPLVGLALSTPANVIITGLNDNVSSINLVLLKKMLHFNQFHQKSNQSSYYLSGHWDLFSRLLGEYVGLVLKSMQHFKSG